MRLIRLPDNHDESGSSVVEILTPPAAREQIREILGGPFDTVASVSLLDACGMRDVSDYRVIPVMLVRRRVDGLAHNRLASDSYSPDSHVYGAVLLAGVDQSAGDDSEVFQDPPEQLFKRWIGPAGPGWGGGADGDGS